MTRIPGATTLLTIATTLLASLAPSAAHADTVVQIPLPGLLEGRSVTTLTNGNLVVFTLRTDGGPDNNPDLQNAFATQAVATLKGKPIANALPDDGHFPANARHPDVILNFSNSADAASPQTHLVPVSGSFNFAVPAATYSKLFLFFNGAAGGSSIKVTLTYSDATEMQNATIPDYYADVSPTDPVIFNLATDLAKWAKDTTVKETGHHNITGAEFHPMAGKTLTKVQVDRDANGTLIFWGATGIATSAVVVGGGGAGGTSGVAGAGGTSPTGGSAGTGGTSANGGSAGAATGAAGASSAGAPSSAGSANNAGSANTTPGAGAGNVIIQTTPANDSGCGCRLAVDRSAAPRTAWLAFGAVIAWGLRRKRRNALRQN